MALVTTPATTPTDGYILLTISNMSPTFEEVNTAIRYYPFNLVINAAFETTGTTPNSSYPLAFADTSSLTTYYPLVDSLNKPITGYELYFYAGRNRTIPCIYDDLYKVVRVFGQLLPDVLEVPSTASASASTST